MKILIVTNYYHPEIGAASSRMNLMSEHLQKLGHDIEILCPLPNYPHGRVFENYRNKIFKYEIINKIKVFRLFILPSNSGNIILRLSSMLSFAISLWIFAFRVKSIKQKDIIIIQNSPLFVSFSANILFGVLYNKPTVLNVSDLWPLSALEIGILKKGLMFKFLKTIEKYNYKISKAFMGQSIEILDYLNKYNEKPKFLYRNIPNNNSTSKPLRAKNHKILYAGLLGLAQGILSIIENVNFKEIGAEFHIYGDGAEKSKIEDFLIKNPKCNVFYRGSISKSELNQIIPNFYASIIPLKTSIYGAVPSKIFELISHGVPILFSGDGEGFSIVKDNHLGYCNKAGDYYSLCKNISLLINLDSKSYSQIQENCINLSKSDFNFKNQIDSLNSFLNNNKI